MSPSSVPSNFLCVNAPQAVKLSVLLTPCLLIAGVSTLFLLALMCGQISSDDVIDVILPQPQKLKTPHPILVGPGGEPLQLADGQPLGVTPNPAGALLLWLVTMLGVGNASLFSLLV